MKLYANTFVTIGWILIAATIMSSSEFVVEEVKEVEETPEKDTNLRQEPDLVDLIVKDHAIVKEAYRKIQESQDESENQKVYEQMMWDIARHAVAEELVRINCF